MSATWATRESIFIIRALRDAGYTVSSIQEETPSIQAEPRFCPSAPMRTNSKAALVYKDFTDSLVSSLGPDL